jgi:purine-binding chemotaxis protein CheW
MEDSATTEIASRQLLRLSSGGERLLVPIDAVREILEVAGLTPVPQTPAFVRGVMNLRGAVVPVLDLSARLDLAPTRLARRSAIIVVESLPAPPQDRMIAGLLVDAVFEVIDLGDQVIESVPSLGVAVPANFLSGMLNVRGDYAGILNLNQLLEPQALAKLIGDNAAGSPRH